MSSTSGSSRMAMMGCLCLTFAFLFFLLGAVLVAKGMKHSSSTTPTASGAQQDEPHESGGLFSSLRRAVSSDGPEKPGFEDGHPVGLYFMTRYWIATSSLEKAVWYFTKDGKAYLNPEDGFTEEKLASSQQKGTMSMDGDTMTITWSDGKEEKSALEHAEGGFNWDMGMFTPVEPFTDASQLVGRWEGGESVHFSGDTAMAAKGLDMKDDGTFSGETVASFNSQDETSTAHAGSQGSTSGKWSLDGYSLVLTYDDGRVVRGITFPFNDERAQRFYFAGTMYKKS